MKSGMLISILMACLAIPVLAARDPNPRRGVRRMVVLLFVASIAYSIYLTRYHVVAYVPQWVPAW